GTVGFATAPWLRVASHTSPSPLSGLKKVRKSSLPGRNSGYTSSPFLSSGMLIDTAVPSGLRVTRCESSETSSVPESLQLPPRVNPSRGINVSGAPSGSLTPRSCLPEAENDIAVEPCQNGSFTTYEPGTCRRSNELR